MLLGRVCTFSRKVQDLGFGLCGLQSSVQKRHCYRTCECKLCRHVCWHSGSPSIRVGLLTSHCCIGFLIIDYHRIHTRIPNLMITAPRITFRGFRAAAARPHPRDPTSLLPSCHEPGPKRLESSTITKVSGCYSF